VPYPGRDPRSFKDGYIGSVLEEISGCADAAHSSTDDGNLGARPKLDRLIR
jgi:hypothetical protein